MLTFSLPHRSILVLLLVTILLLVVAGMAYMPIQAQESGRGSASPTPFADGFRGAPNRILDQLIDKKYLVEKTGTLVFQQEEDNYTLKLAKASTIQSAPLSILGSQLSASKLKDLNRDFSSFVMSSDITWSTPDQERYNACGFMVHYQGTREDHTLYAIQIVRIQMIFVDYWDGSRWRSLVEKGASVNSQNGATNQFLVLAQGADIKLFINGLYAGVFQSTQASSGQIGITAFAGPESKGTNCTFSNTWLWDLKPGSGSSAYEPLPLPVGAQKTGSANG